MGKFMSLITLTLALFLPISATAMSCHCFTDREYDSGQPAVADPYFLTTTENSFFAVINGMKKKDVVFAKQTPSTTAENLWIAYWLAEKTGEQTKTLMKARFRNRSWLTALSALNIKLNELPVRVRIQLESDPDDLGLATVAIDTFLEERDIVPT